MDYDNLPNGGDLLDLQECIASMFALNASSDDRKGYAQGWADNCKWSLFGPDCDSQARGELHLANAQAFDRWANSRSIVVKVNIILMETQSLSWQGFVKRLVSLFDDAKPYG